MRSVSRDGASQREHATTHRQQRRISSVDRRRCALHGLGVRALQRERCELALHLCRGHAIAACLERPSHTPEDTFTAFAPVTFVPNVWLAPQRFDDPWSISPMMVMDGGPGYTFKQQNLINRHGFWPFATRAKISYYQPWHTTHSFTATWKQA